MPQQQQIRVDLSTLKDIKCTCGNDCFIAVSKFKVIPLFYSQTGKEELLALNCVKCTNCGSVYTADELQGIEKIVMQ